MKKILVPIDFSKEAEYAARAAASIAKKTGSAIYLVHMLELPTETIDINMSSVSTEPQIIYYMKLAHKKFEEFKQLPFFEGIQLVESIQFSHAFVGIIEESKKNAIDLIVMGSQGASGLQEMFIGSNTEKVVRQSKIPVIVIKQEMESFEINNLIFASDFEEESKKTFQKVIDFAAIFDSKIHLLYVNTIHNFSTTPAIESKIESFIEDFDLRDYTRRIYNEVSIEQGILSYGRDIHADIIALNTHGRSGLSQLFNGSIGQELTNHALRPVVTFKI